MSQAPTPSSKPQTPSRFDVIEEARLWRETPVLHQHAIRGFGVDCWHLVREVGLACEVLPPISDEAWAPYAGYARLPHPDTVLAVAERFLLPVPDGEQLPADICLIAWRPNLPQHFAMLTEFDRRPYLLHAWAEAPVRTDGRRTTSARGKVVEHGLAGEWPPLVHSWWRYPGLAEAPWHSLQ